VILFASDQMISPEFHPLPALVGGLLIGVSAASLLWLNGRIAGISGIVQGSLAARSGDIGWRLVFIAGLAIGGALGAILAPGSAIGQAIASPPMLALAGVLVGIGTAYAGGCTSGHGVCGLARLSLRSLLATITFMLAGMLTVFVVRHVIAGGA